LSDLRHKIKINQNQKYVIKLVLINQNPANN
jgi:hypothetical protein